ncbi:MAG: cyclic nucleotide-binding domain-containing protein, partial [Myxococcota bacterium]|nr:cyclic nucleotide-binding domain-containing protein [Myxococcota bacterium]
WGGASALSLPLGAALGLWLRTSRKVTSALMAFGGGALLFALTLELFGHALHMAEDAHGRLVKPAVLLVTIAAAALGGFMFFLLNRLLEGKGAFLRKATLIRKHIAKERRAKARKLLRALGQIEFFRKLPVEEVIRLLPDVQPAHFEAGTAIFREGEIGDCLYVIAKGEVGIEREGEQQEELALLGPGSVFGEMALVTLHPRRATAIARTKVHAWRVLREDFARHFEASPDLRAQLDKVVERRLGELAARAVATKRESQVWSREALRRFDDHLPQVDRAALKQHTEHGGSALAIWLGMVLDGIPESLLIGMLAVVAAGEGHSMSLAFIVGVFIANLPEAMSSAVTMRHGGMGIPKILWMWFSLCALAAIGAFVGASLFPSTPSGAHLYLLYIMEGLAGGAMLTMIAETMLPEAFEQGGGPIVGLSTLSGFLAALSVKLIH